MCSKCLIVALSLSLSLTTNTCTYLQFSLEKKKGIFILCKYSISGSNCSFLSVFRKKKNMPLSRRGQLIFEIEYLQEIQIHLTKKENRAVQNYHSPKLINFPIKSCSELQLRLLERYI